MGSLSYDQNFNFLMEPETADVDPELFADELMFDAVELLSQSFDASTYHIDELMGLLNSSEDDQEFDIDISMLDDQLSTRPASDASLKALENLIFDVGVHGSDVQCSICLETLLSGAPVTRMPCSHLFHGQCVAPWFKRSSTCPLCRHDLQQRPNVFGYN